MENEKYHRLNSDPTVLSGFSRTLPEIEWLLLVLILFYQLVGDIEPASKPTFFLASVIYSVLIITFQYTEFLKENTEWKMAIQTWIMIFYIGYVIWFLGEINTPLYNLYLLPIVASALTLGKLTAWLETLFIGVNILYLQNVIIKNDSLWSLAGSSEWLMQFFPLLLVAYILTMLAADIQKGFNQLKVVSETDELTKLFNRRSLAQISTKLFKVAARHNRTVSVIMVDVDKLKPINDNYGHEAGNLLLTSVAGCMESVLRQGDIAARYGGDEFVILLSDCSAVKAEQVARRIIERFNESNIRYQGNKMILSASFGVAAFPENGQGLDELIQCADMAMYSSKQRGSNLITSYEENLQAVS
jgi:diguanylate cyclase (GGDEF)-like protein